MRILFDIFARIYLWELTRQKDADLWTSEERKPLKPVLPKSHAAAKTNGASMLIKQF